MRPKPAARRAPGVAPDFFSSQVAEARRFYLDLKPARERPLAVVCGGLEHCRADYRIQRSTFPYYSLEYVVRGRGEVLLGGHRQVLSPGRVFAYGPGVSQRIQGDREEPLVKYFVDFTGRDAVGLLRGAFLLPGQVAQVAPPGALQPLFEELIRAGTEGRRDSTALCDRLLECLALRLRGARAPMEETETAAFSVYVRCREHMEKACGRLRSLSEVAADCHVSGAYLCRLFRRYDSRTPYQYLLRLKMNAAAERLQSAGVLVKQVAEEAGFADPFHFSRVFRSVLGVSPAAFRDLRSPGPSSSRSSTETRRPRRRP